MRIKFEDAPEAAGPSRTPTLLQWRLTALGLNPVDLAQCCPDILQNLKTTCAQCTDKQRCLDDMMDYVNPPGWESYCPNSSTLRTLL